MLYRARLLSIALALVTLSWVAGCSVLNLSTSCSDDSDCYLDEHCIDGACRATDAGDAVAVECVTLENCNGETYCLDGRCVDLPGCPSAACPEGTHCWPNDLTCRRLPPPCTLDEDCEDDLYCTVNVCNPESLTCEVRGTPCSSEAPVCEEATATCHLCTENEHCDDGQFCNGDEFCVDNKCIGGNAPCDPDSATFRCDEDRDVCAECLDDSHCAVDDPCTINRRCNAAGQCTAGASPCSDPTPTCVVQAASTPTTDGGVVDADGGATDSDGGTAAPLSFRCICLGAADCDDGLWCTGEERCENEVCVTDGNPCDGSGLSCLEGLQECGACVQDTDCDQLDLCIGYQTCDLASGDCLNNGDQLMCAAPEGVCSSDIQACVQCEVFGECPLIPDSDPLWTSKDATEDSRDGCFDKVCTSFNCSWERRCPGDGNPQRDICGCDGNNCADRSDWDCRECNNDTHCSQEKGGLFCEDFNNSCQPCRNENTNTTDPGCENEGQREHCLELFGDNSCEVCTTNPHCDDADPCTIDTCGIVLFGNAKRFCDYADKCEDEPLRRRCHATFTNGNCEECYQDGHCQTDGNPRTNVCINNDCEDCRNNSDCSGHPDGNYCDGDNCVECINDNHCPGSSVCINRQCRECRDNGDCDDGNNCTNDVCQFNNTCSFPNACPGQECVSTTGVCVDCLNNGDCNDGDNCTDNICNVGSGTCSFPAKCQMDEICLGNGSCVECTNNNHCDDSDNCTNNICNNNSCTFPAKCQMDEVCQADGSCVECVNDGQCAGSSVCENNQCVECRNDGQCAGSSVCENNQCVECRNAAQCNDGNNCTNDVCTNNSCSNPDACPGQACITTTGQCVACINNGDCSGNPAGNICDNNQCVECVGNGDCNDGNNCTNDVCSNNSCSNPDACPGEECIAATGQCVECINNNDCNGNPAGNFCDNNQCVECINNGDCSDGDNCTTDTCSNNSCSFPDACPGEACVPATGQCVECVNDGDCTMPQTCDTGTNTCTG